MIICGLFAFCASSVVFLIIYSLNSSITNNIFSLTTDTYNTFTSIATVVITATTDTTNASSTTTFANGVTITTTTIDVTTPTTILTLTTTTIGNKFNILFLIQNLILFQLIVRLMRLT